MTISVIIPLYNAEKFIAKALDSCLVLPEVKEIVVVDDGFKDNAKNIVKEYQQKYSFIKLFEHPNNENKGAGASRNLGIENATQDYIAFLDADDFYLPNRFEKDKEIFEKNPDADGSYNAIGCYFYSEKAREQFLTHFQSERTSVNPEANPTPENLFKGLLGMLPGFGYFHLNGLTLKRKFLIKSKVKFADLRIHQDTVFIFKIAYLLKLFPSNINEDVAMRGVHEENRITANYDLEETKKNHKRFLMWDSLYQWFRKENMDSEIKKFIKGEKDYYRLTSKESQKSIILFKEIILNFNILKNRKYLQLHRMFFSNIPFDYRLYQLRNLLVKFF